MRIINGILIGVAIGLWLILIGIGIYYVAKENDAISDIPIDSSYVDYVYFM